MRTVRHRLLPSLVALLALVIAVPIAGAQEPEPEPVATILPGSTIARIDVGGMTEEQALATVRAQFAQPIVLTVGKKQHTVTGTQLRARYAIARAVDEALARTGVGNTPVGIEFNQKRLDRTVRRLLDRVGTQGSEPSWRIRPRPRIVPGKAGITASERKIRTQIVQALEDPSLRPGQDAIPLRKVRTTPTLANMGYVVTISKNDLKLRLWRPKGGKARAVRTFRIAVGAPAFPTPRGRFTIVESVVVPAGLRLGEGGGAGTAGALQPTRDALDGARPFPDRHPRHAQRGFPRELRLPRVRPDGDRLGRVVVRSRPRGDSGPHPLGLTGPP